MSNDRLDPLARLAAANPVAGEGYQPRDLADMLARVVAPSTAPPIQWARGLRWRVGTAFAASAVATVVGIVALQGTAPVLSVLAIQSAAARTPAASSPANGADGSQYSFSAQAPSATGETAAVRLVAGARLSRARSAAPIYLLVAPGNLAAASARIAGAFGVVGAPSSAPSANGTWTVRDARGALVSFSATDAVLTWRYQSARDSAGLPPSYPAPTTNPTLPRTALVARAVALVRATGYRGRLGTADLVAEGALSTAVVVPRKVGGPGSGLSFVLNYTSEGVLETASGTAATVRRGATYPLISEVAGVRLLQRAESPPTAAGISGPPTSTGTAPPSAGTTPSSINPGGPMIPVSPTTTTVPADVTGPASTSSATTTVVLTSAVLVDAPYLLDNGTEALLPQYRFGASDGSTWDVLAISPSLIKDSSPVGGVAEPLSL